MKEKKRAKNKPLPSQKELWEEFNYDSDTGILQRKSNKQLIHKPNKFGHLTVHFKSKAYYVHRLIFKMIMGRDPYENMIVEHKNGNPQDNRWSNLREATQAENMCNRSFLKNKNTGVVPSRYSEGKWIASISKNKKHYHLGTFNTFEEACAARKEAVKKYFGEFAPNSEAK